MGWFAILLLMLPTEILSIGRVCRTSRVGPSGPQSTAASNHDDASPPPRCCCRALSADAAKQKAASGRKNQARPLAARRGGLEENHHFTKGPTGKGEKGSRKGTREQGGKHFWTKKIYTNKAKGGWIKGGIENKSTWAKGGNTKHLF